MLQDLKFAVRTLFRSPGFTATAAVTLALGIGVTSLMFSVVNAVLLRPLPYPDQERLMLVFNTNTTDPDVNTIRASVLDFEDYRARARSFEAMAGHVGTGFTFSGSGTPELVLGQNVTSDFFRVFSVEPMLGRTFTADEFSPGRETVAVISYRLWKRRFGAQPSVVGSTVTINGRPFTITGVMPPAFEYPGQRYELWTPLPSPAATADAPPRNRDAHYLQIVGRVQSNVSSEQANTEIATIAGALAAQYPASNRNLTARATPLVDYTVRAVKEPLYMLLGAVGLVVLIACANVTNLLLARATARHREVAIRQALGAARWRLIRQFLAETAVLYTLGAAGAIALASWGAAALVAIGPPEIPRLADTSLDGRVLAATALLSMITALVFGLAPAVQGAAADPSDALRTGGRTASAGRGRQRFRTVLVISEVALSVVLLIGAGLALHSLVRLTNVDPGFDADGQLTFSVVLSPRRFADARSMSAAVDRLVEGLAAAPGVAQVGVTTHLPLSGQNMENSFSVDGYTPAPGEVPVAGMRGVAGDYFAALGARLKAGRTFAATDRMDSQPVAIVNETFVRIYFKGQNPIGKRVSEGGNPGWRTVVGVIADVKHSGPAAQVRPEVSLPYAQLEPTFMTTWSRGVYFVVRGKVPASALAPLARQQAAAIDPDMSLNEMQSMAELASDAVSEPRFRTMLLGTFAALAVALASIGVFGVLSYFVTQRTREIGIRVALGASAGDILRMVVGRGLVLAGIGLAIGLLAAIPLTRSMQTLLFEVKPLDLPTLAFVIAGLALVAGLASYLPARRALRIEPMMALNLD